MEQYDAMNIYKMLFGNIFLISTKLETIGTKYLDELTTKQWFILAVIITLFKDQDPGIKQLSQVVGLSHQNTKQLALRLEQKGFVEIIQDQEDRRISRIKLTPKVNEYSAEHEESDYRFIDNMFDGISPEMAKDCLTVLDRLGENLDKMAINIGGVK